MSLGSICAPRLEAMSVLGMGTPSRSQETWWPPRIWSMSWVDVGAGDEGGDAGEGVGAVGAGGVGDVSRG